MTRRRPAKDKKDIGETLEQVWGWISKPTWSKIASGVLAILIGLWGYLNLGDGIESADKRLDTQGTRLASVEQVVDGLDDRFDDIEQRADDIEAGGKDLNRAIAKAVSRGIERGVEQVMDEIRAMVRRLVGDT